MDVAGILELAGTAANTIKSATETVKSIRELASNSNNPKMQELALKLYDLLIDARETQVHLEDQISQLRREIESQDTWKDMADRYQLSSSPAGAIYWQLVAKNGEPDHRICPVCYENHVRSILQKLNDYTERCPVCQQVFDLRATPIDGSYLQDF